MKVLIFGGTGFIGKRVVKLLLEKGNRVIIFSHKRKLYEEKGVEYINGDILDKNAIKEALDLDPDLVINLVGIIREIPKRGISFKAMHFDAVEKLVNSLLDFNNNIPLIQMSANGVETGKDITDYFKYKYKAEEKIKSSGLKYAIIRPSIVIGEDEGIVKDLSSILKFGIFPLPKINVKFSPIRVEVVAERIVGIAEDILKGKLESNVIKLCGEEEMNFRELIEYIASINKKKVIFIPTPLLLFRIVAFLGDKFSFIPLNTTTLKMLLQGNICSNNTNYVRY